MPGAPDRFQLNARQPTMKAVVTTGVGGYERLEYRDVPRPVPAMGEVLLQVLAAGVNNTEINTRVGWYSAAVTAGTEAAAVAAEHKNDGRTASGWSGITPFPLIQGTDCCGRVVADTTGQHARGTRVLVRPCSRSSGWSSLETVWLGSNFDGAFAQFLKVAAADVFPVRCDWSDAELGSIPCAYGTAENLLLRAGLERGERVLIAGASGGVGSAAVQLARRRGAVVTAIGAAAKLQALRAAGADHTIDRDTDLVSALGENSIDVVIDIVAGPAFPTMLRVLRRGGRYACAGAIAGPLVTLDLRNLYLKDLRMLGCTAWEQAVFPNLIGYIERGEIRPLVAKTFPLAHIKSAQQEFLEKRHVGNFVLMPPNVEA
jgi:NADPH:quinone reductase-like Zn-dependent oxidoreductase